VQIVNLLQDLQKDLGLAMLLHLAACHLLDPPATV
jgi:hypothetical protein